MALHSDQIKYLYCEQCEEAVCAVCVHAEHSDCRPKPVEVAAAAKKTRDNQSAELKIIAGPPETHGAATGAHGSGAAVGLDTLIGVKALRAKISEMQTGQPGSGRLMGERREDVDGQAAAMGCRSTAV